MPRLRTLEIRSYPDTAAPLTLTFSLGSNILYGPPGPARDRLLALLRGVISGDFRDVDQAFDLQATFVVPGGEATLTIRRPSPGAPVEIVQEDAVQLVTDLPEGHAHLIWDGTDRLLQDLHAPDGLRSLHWLPVALARASEQGTPGEPVSVDLSRIPELAGLWWHLEYERGTVTLTEPGGALGLQLFEDGASRGLASLDAKQRVLVSLFLYLSCRPTPLFGVDLDDLSEEALDDVLRHVEPPMFGGLPRRQSFFVAETSALMYRMNLNRVDDVKAAFVLCAPGQPWRALSDAEAKRYFQYYEREFRQIDSLMRLW